VSEEQRDYGGQVRQDVGASRDAYSASRDMIVHLHSASIVAGDVSIGRRIWGNVPARNLGFTGRDALLMKIRDQLMAGNRTVVQALHGMGGVGKTQLAVEYAHRFAADYNLIWWVIAEKVELIGEQFAALSEEMGSAQPGAGLAAMRRAVLTGLRERDRWLLVFDNASSPRDLADWLPGGNGHVLITSRTRDWSEIAIPVEINVLARTESVEILQRRVAGLHEVDADLVAEALGDLPLAVAQAAAYMAATGISAVEYTNLLADRASEILDQGRPLSYMTSLSAAIQLMIDQLRVDEPAAAELAELCAFLAPEPIPVEWFTEASSLLPGPLAEIVDDPVRWRRVLAQVGSNSLARVDFNGIQMHRLTQAIVRDHILADLVDVLYERVCAILAACAPGDPQAPYSWPSWRRLLPHLLALDPKETSNADLREIACDAAWYLVWRGDAGGGYDLAGSLHQRWQDRFGRDHPDTLRAAATLAASLRGMGRYEQARRLDEDILIRRRRVLGEDHPNTLQSTNSLAADLYMIGDLAAAQGLDKDTFDRSRRILGEDHQDTLASASNLAADLRALGDVVAARGLDEDTFERSRRVLGEDHPDTLRSASNLAADLRALGDVVAARGLDEDTFDRSRRVLGEDHPDTIACANALAADLQAPGTSTEEG